MGADPWVTWRLSGRHLSVTPKRRYTDDNRPTDYEEPVSADSVTITVNAKDGLDQRGSAAITVTATAAGEVIKCADNTPPTDFCIP